MDRAARGSRCRRHAGPDTGRRADVPIQQPRRAAHVAAGHRRLLCGARDRGRQLPVDRPDGRGGRVRLPDQDDAGVPAGTGVRACVPGGSSDLDRSAVAGPAGRRRRSAGRRGLVRGGRGVVAEECPTVHRRLDQQQFP